MAIILKPPNLTATEDLLYTRSMPGHPEGDETSPLELIAKK